MDFQLIYTQYSIYIYTVYPVIIDTYKVDNKLDNYEILIIIYYLKTIGLYLFNVRITL